MPKPMKQEKAKNFKSSVTRLFKELKSFKILITFALLFAACGSILALVSPNKLSDLVDEISKGLIVNRDNIQILSSDITKNLQNIDIQKVMTSDADYEAKTSFMMKIQNIDHNDKKEFIKVLENTDSKIINIILPTLTIDKTKISSSDQIKFLSLLSDVDIKDVNKLYSKLDKLPKNIKKVIEPTMDQQTIKNIAIFLICLYIISALLTYFEGIIMTHVSNNFAKSLRTNITKKINVLPLKYFDRNTHGDLLSKVTNDIDTIGQSMNQSISELVSSITLLIGSIVMMFYTNWLMALTAIFASLFGFIFMALVLKKSQTYFSERQKYLGKINGHIEETFSGLNVVKTYNGSELANEKFDKLNEKVYEANQKSQFLSGLIMPMMGFVGNLGYVAVCIVGALLSMNGHISFGTIIAFIVYVRLFTQPLSKIGQSMTSIQSAAAASERVFELLDEKPMDEQKNIKKHLDISKAKGNIEFKNIEFTYDGKDKPTIKNFNAIVKPGQKVAIVGPTGAGKTTMVNLLMKFYEINKGKIIIDGYDTSELSRENIHDLFTMVLQDTWLFDGTINENIKYNHLNVRNKDVQKVCKTVGLDHFINTLPKGYDSKIGNNNNISAGQKQLLTIARGMIKDAPFLILDEATSNVDTRTEELVQKAMDKLTKNKTSFIIAHRLSTIKNADLILVMDKGNIIEQGTHKELIKKKGFYAELYNSQFQL